MCLVLFVFCTKSGCTRNRLVQQYIPQVVIRYGPQLAVDGLEVIFYPRWYPEQERIGNVLRTCGLRFPVIHLDKRIGAAFGNGLRAEQEQGVDWFECNCAFAQQIGARIAVLHLWGMPHLDTHLEHNLRPLTRCLDIVQRYGLELAIETIPCISSDPLSNVKRAYEHDARSRIALDSEFLAIHNQLDDVFAASWLWQKGLVRHVHLKDYDGNPFPEGGPRRCHTHPGEFATDQTLSQGKLAKYTYHILMARFYWKPAGTPKVSKNP